jgi:hypothetical protein
MTAPKKDPSAMAELRCVMTWCERHSRNVTKQRRRLLAEAVELMAADYEMTALYPCTMKRDPVARATKLRALAERLRGETR